MLIKIEIVGQDAPIVTEDLLAINGIDGTYEIPNSLPSKGTLVTIATIIGITSGSLTIAEKLYELNRKYRDSVSPAGSRIEKVMIVHGDKRLLLEDATIEQIKNILDS